MATKPRLVCKFCGDSTEGTIGVEKHLVCVKCWKLGGDFHMSPPFFYDDLRTKGNLEDIHKSLDEAMRTRNGNLKT